jgi:hypothetical protein
MDQMYEILVYLEPGGGQGSVLEQVRRAVEREHAALGDPHKLTSVQRNTRWTVTYGGASKIECTVIRTNTRYIIVAGEPGELPPIPDGEVEKVAIVAVFPQSNFCKAQTRGAVASSWQADRHEWVGDRQAFQVRPERDGPLRLWRIEVRAYRKDGLTAMVTACTGILESLLRGELPVNMGDATWRVDPWSAVKL